MENVAVLTTVQIRNLYDEMAKLEKKYFHQFMFQEFPITPTAWRNKLRGDSPMTMPQRKRATEFFEAWNKNILLQ